MEFIPARHISTSPGCKDRNSSIYSERGYNLERKKQLRISRTASLSSTLANMCMYNASNSANWRSF
jgi:hypothetical protein